MLSYEPRSRLIRRPWKNDVPGSSGCKRKKKRLSERKRPSCSVVRLNKRLRPRWLRLQLS
jgi:hypothetical protein